MQLLAGCAHTASLFSKSWTGQKVQCGWVCVQFAVLLVANVVVANCFALMNVLLQLKSICLNYDVYRLYIINYKVYYGKTVQISCPKMKEVTNFHHNYNFFFNSIAFNSNKNQDHVNRSIIMNYRTLKQNPLVYLIHSILFIWFQWILACLQMIHLECWSNVSVCEIIITNHLRRITSYTHPTATNC